MGAYVQVPVSQGKASAIIAGQVMIRMNGQWKAAGPYEAVRLDAPPASFGEIPEGVALVVVVANPMFEAAGLAYCEAEFNEFTRAGETRPREYILMSKATAEAATGYQVR